MKRYLALAAFILAVAAYRVSAISVSTNIHRGPTTYAAQQVDFAPPVALGGKWRVVENTDFQDGLTITTARTYIEFRNCKFDGVTSFSNTDYVRFIDCTIDSVTGTALTLTNCDYVEFENVVMDTITSEAIKLDTCTNVSMRDVRITDATTTAAAMTIATSRSRIFENTSNWSEPNVVFAAVHLEGCTSVSIDGLRMEGVTRTGLFVRDSTNVTVKNIETIDGHDFSSGSTAMNDDPIMIMDSTHVLVSGGRIIRPDRHAVYVHETVPATAAGGLGLLLSDVTIENLYISMYDSDSPAAVNGSYGIFVRGGKNVRILNNEIARCGEAGIEFGNMGTDDALVMGNRVYDCGQNTDLIHFDGFSFQCGRGLRVIGNVFEDNYRSGIQLKPGYLQTGGFGNEYPCADAIFADNVIVGNGRDGTGYGINLLDSGSGSNRQYMDRITFRGNVLYNNDVGNFLATTGSGNIHLVGNHFGESGATANVKWQDSYNVSIFGGFIHGQAVTGQNFLARASDSGGASQLSHIVGVHFQGVDISELNRRNTDLAVANATDPDTDTLEDALDDASTAEGRDIRIHNFFGGSTSGSTTVRDISEVQDADRADVAILVDGDGPVFLNRNRSSTLVSTGHDLQVADLYMIEPAQLLLSENAGGTGPGWGDADAIYAANGFAWVYGISGDDTGDVTDVETMLQRGWLSGNVLPSTTEFPVIQAISDGSAEAYAPLETAP